MLYAFFVLIRALCTGGMTIFRLESELMEHADPVEFVQSWDGVMWGSVMTGGMTGGNVDTHIEFVASTIENGVVADFLRCEGWVDVQLTVLDEKILVKRSGHFKFVIADRSD